MVGPEHPSSELHDSRTPPGLFMSRTPGPWRRGHCNQEHGHHCPQVSRARCRSQWAALVERKKSHPAKAERGSCLGAWESPSMCSWPPNAPVSEQSHTLGIGAEFHMRYYQYGRERERERVRILLSVPKVVGGGWIKTPMVSPQSTIHLSSLRTNPLT